MKVILLGEVRGKGGEGDVVDVAQGYAENYLFPKHLALPATAGNIKQLEERRHNIEVREAKRVSDAESLRDKLDNKVISMEVKVGEEGQLFGSVTNAMVGDAVKAQLDVDLDRKRIEIRRPIKTAGMHSVNVNLYRTISATLILQVGTVADIAAAKEAAEKAEAEKAEAVAAEVAEEAAVAETPEVAETAPETPEVAAE